MDFKGLPYISLGYLQSAAACILFSFNILANQAILQSQIKALESRRRRVNLGRLEKAPGGIRLILLLYKNLRKQQFVNTM